MEMTVDYDVPIRLRDGVLTFADVYRPRGGGRYPVLLTRTPYDKTGANGYPTPLRGVRSGYAVAIQDVRGRYKSEGEFDPLFQEVADGYDSVEWCARLPYSNGKVGMFGGSYVGATQMLAAIAAPPHLVGIVPNVTASDYHEHWAYQGGAFMQLLAQAWSSALSIDVLSRRSGASAVPAHWDYRRPPAAYPVIESPKAEGAAQYYFDWIAHPAYDDYWRQWSIAGHYGLVTVPAVHVAGWYDLFQDGSIRNYMGLKRRAATQEARRGQRLIIVPGGHSGYGPKIGDVDFGPASGFDIEGYGLRWFDHLMKGIDNGIDREKPVRIFVMGRNVWRDEDDWPLARAKAVRYYLHSGAGANSAAGDGALSTEAPGAEPADSYVCDPDDPVPTRGGPVLGDTANYPPGPLDQRPLEARRDVLVYTTAAFASDTEVTGPVSLELYASSSAPDTDFTGKLVDVAPDGTAINLTEGILRARYRDSMEKSSLMNPGETYRIVVDLWSTSNVFLAGHRLRLEVASGNFPRFDRNPNTGANPEAGGPYAKATNVIRHDGAHPSALVVQVVP